MKQGLLITCLVVALQALVGCSSDANAATKDKELRAKFDQSAHFDINKIPQNQRALVQGFIDRQKAGVSAAKAHEGG